MLTDTAETVLQRRYYLKGENSECVEDWPALCTRVARAVASKETDSACRADYQSQFFSMIYNLDFLPNSPCLMNAGTDIGQLSACFVLPVDDSMDGIFTAVRNGALVHKTGGGTGYSFSRLRAKNTAVKSTQGIASGPLSFMEVFNTATETIKQGGKRRGANMGVLRVDHPDVLEFIDAKEDLTKLTNFNLSVALTDEFMRAVEVGGLYSLIDPVSKEVTGILDARTVFDRIVDRAWRTGEPGVLFIDAANRANPTPWLGDFEATNPCGEQWLLPYESCNLGSINLGNFVRENKTIDYSRLNAVIRCAVRFLDNVVDCNNFPIPEIAEMTKSTRKIGLGIMGLHDMLIQMELPYDSEEGRKVSAQVMQFVQETALSYSEKLANDKGVFPACCADPETAPYKPRRNAALTSIQPTGTVSMIADCSSGCEPYFSIVMIKHVMDGDRLLMVNKHFERIAKQEGWYSDKLMEEIALSGTVSGNAKVPPHWREIFATAQDISPEAHINMQAELQKYVQASISKTINLPNSATKEEVGESYMKAWKLGCKGLTIYRDGCRDNQVLNAGTKEAQAPAESSPVLAGEVNKAILPDVLSAKRYRLKDSNQETMYLIVCFDENERPMEVFAKFPFDNQHNLKEKSTMWTTTCRMVSLALRCAIPMEEIIKQLDRSSGHMLDLPSQLGKLLKSFMATTQHGYAAPCPECEGGKLVFKEGCESCEVCGYSKCS